ncbi:MAG: hypothetical protein KKD28_06705, partial [Chloroflexi bacterium]|nr:hypothetical protein [Chloroflexota bacterium]
MNFKKELATEIQNARQDGIDASEIWDLFENATPEQQAMIFVHTLEAGLLDDEYAFEFLTTIRGDIDPVTPEGWAYYTDLLDRLREEDPKLFQDSSHHYHRDLISFAIIEGRWEELSALLTPYLLGEHLDLFTMIIAQLKYHGQVRTLVDAMTTAWPKLKDSTKYVAWASEEFAGTLMELMLVDYLQTTAEHRPNDPKFLEATAFLLPWKEGWLDWFVPTVTQTKSTDWCRADFSEDAGSEPWRHKFSTMQVEFIAAQWRAGVPLTRGLLAWDKWSELFHAQFEAVIKSQKRHKRGQKAKVISLSRYFIPQARKLDKILG